MARHGSTAACNRDTSLPSALAEAARLQEVALHVDDHQRGARQIEAQRLRCRGDGQVGHAALPRDAMPVYRGALLHQPRHAPAVPCAAWAGH
jgi:hypothetical protein